MKLQDVILKAMAKKISWLEAAEIIGVCDRTMRRMREGYQKFGYAGLGDRRSGKRVSHRVPMETAEEVLRLYREEYFDLNIRHFHEKLRDKHQIELSYTWVQQALQGAGLVAKRRKRGPHRRSGRGGRCRACCCTSTAASTAGCNDDRWHDLIVILDDATSEIYYAQLVEEESTRTVMAGLREVIETKGLFCALYSDRGSHFFVTAKAGDKVDKQRPTQVGRAMKELGVQMIAAYSPQARGPVGAQFRNLAGTIAAGTAAGGNHDGGRGQPLSAGAVHRGVQRKVHGGGGAERHGVPAYAGGADLDWIFTVQTERVVAKDNTVAIGGTIVADRQDSIPSYAGGLHGDDPRTPGWHHLDPLRSPRRRAIRGKRGTPWKSGKPAKNAGFPLSHRDDGDGRFSQTKKAGGSRRLKPQTGQITN